MHVKMPGVQKKEASALKEKSDCIEVYEKTSLSKLVPNDFTVLISDVHLVNYGPI